MNNHDNKYHHRPKPCTSPSDNHLTTITYSHNNDTNHATSISTFTAANAANNRKKARSPFNQHWFILSPAWISNHMSSKVWDEITYHFPNFNASTVEVYMVIITYPCWYQGYPILVKETPAAWFTRHTTYKYSLLIGASKLKAPRNLYWMSNMFLWVEIFLFSVCYHVVPKRHSQLDYELNGL